MRFARPAFLLLPSIFFCIPVAAQPPPQRDPQALAILAQMVTATGWVRGSLPSDVDATGNLVRQAGVTNPIRLRARGTRQFRLDLEVGGRQRSRIVSGPAGAYVNESGQARRLAPHVAVSTRAVMFPFLLLVHDFDQPDVSVRYLGTENVAGQPAHQIALSREPVGDDVEADAMRRSLPLIVWISTTNFVPVQLDYVRLADSNRRAALHFIRRFSDYRLVNGLLVPFVQQEWAEGELRATWQLSVVRFNVGLSDRDFDVPK